jgi:ElaB/YqjD/DUF883 family membrane-anchored ribosome-binding protein
MADEPTSTTDRPTGEDAVEFTPDAAVTPKSGGSDVAFEADPAVQKRIDDADTSTASGGSDNSGIPVQSARQLVKDGAANLKGQAGDRLHAFASDGKDRATSALDELAKMLEDAAGQVDEKLGAQFGGYARQAATSVQGFAGTVREKDVDELVEEAREFVRKSPGVAIGVAAAVGFALARVLRSGIDANRNA